MGLQLNLSEHVDHETLGRVVRRAVGSERVEIAEWTYQRIHRGAGEGLGVYRFSGGGHDGDEPVSWSLMLKILSPLDRSGVESDWNYWKREILAYQSGLLDDLPGSIVAPRLFDIEERPDGSWWLWQEEVRDGSETAWSLARYGLTARHLGQLNGAYLGARPLPAAPWLCSGWLRSWVEQAAQAVDQLQTMLDHPLVQRVYPLSVVGPLMRLWSERHDLLDTLDHLPRTLCHQDAFRRNLFARTTHDGRDETVVIDWAFVGHAPIGSEIVPLVLATVAFREVDLSLARDLEQIVFENYLEGLREAGYRPDLALVRFGYAASAALRYPLGAVRLVLPFLLDEQLQPQIEQLLDAPFDEIVDHWASFSEMYIGLASEAEKRMRDLRLIPST